MRALKFALASIAYAIVSLILYFLLLFKCGLPFEGSVSCNTNLEWQVYVLAACLIVIYVFASVRFWRRPLKD